MNIFFSRILLWFPRIMTVLIILLCSCLLVMGGFTYLSLQARKPLSVSEEVIKNITIQKGADARTITRQLRDQGFIADTLPFLFFIWEKDMMTTLQAGEYRLSSRFSPAHIASLMARGEVFRDTVSITIPEGFRLYDIEQRLRNNGFFAQESRSLTDLTVNDFRHQYAFLSDAPDAASLEGFLFPDTYVFVRDASMLFVVREMLNNFEKTYTLLLSQNSQKEVKHTSVFNLVTTASLLQKEVITQKDMQLVAGIIQERMTQHMLLQLDASLLYTKDGALQNSIDLSIDSLYNTYRYQGLPPGPIANPGKEALYAALHPLPSEYLFYLSKKNKETVFSRTFGEHNRARARYLR